MSTKVQLTLTDKEAAILADYGKKFGYNLPKTLKFLLSKAAEKVYHSGVVPVFDLPECLEKKGLIALKEHKEGKTEEVKDFEEFFAKL